MSFILALIITVGVGSSFVGLAVYLREPKNSSNKTFAIFALTVVVWAASNYLVDKPLVNELALFWNRLNFTAAISMAVVLFYFSFVFPYKTVFPLFWKIIYLSVSSVLLLLILFSSLGIKNIEFVDYGTNAISGPLFYVGIALTIISILGLFINIGFKYKKSDAIGKIRLKYLIYGLSLSMIIGLSTNLVLPIITGKYEFSKYAPVSMIFLLGFIAYAIIKHQLFNIRVIVTETAAGVVILALLVQTLVSQTVTEGFINGTIFILITYGAYVFIKSVLNDIKQKEQLEKANEQLQEDKKRLMEIDKMKDEFLQMATHELNTPIAVIEGKLSMIMDEDMGGFTPEQKQFLGTISDNSQRLAHLSKDMLNVARIDQKRLTLIKAEVNLVEMASKIVADLQFKAKAKGDTLTFEKPTQSLPKLFIDQTKIAEVFNNLIVNAIKFTKNGTITVKIEPKDGEVICSVKDTGIGIDKVSQAHLFEKFHQVGRFDPKKPIEQQGTGLGLYISKKLIELHYGKIWLESELGKGTTFYFALPINHQEDKVQNG